MKPLSARTIAALSSAGLLASGVASAQETGAYLFLRAPGTTVTARVTPTDITGPDFQLSHSREALRGRAYGRVVSLDIEKDGVGGLVGGLPVRLTLKEKDGALHAQGTFAGETTRFQIGPEELKGRVGTCSYELKATAQRYEGWRSCGGPPEYPVFVEIPPTLTQSGTPTTMAALGLLLDLP